MIIKTQYPDNDLSNIVKEFYFIQIDAKNDSKQIPVIDDCCYDFIFFKEAQAKFYNGATPNPIIINSRIFTINGLKPPYKIVFDNTLTFFTIKLQPWVNNYFFSSIKKQGIIDMYNNNSKFSEIYNNLLKNNSLDEIFNLANEYMLEDYFTLTPSMKFVKELCQFIHERKGIVSVNELSEHFNITRQYLNKVFKKEVKYSLKKYITTVRILDLVKFKSKQNNISLTEVCYDYGYFDQSHFIYDFKKICGVTPRYFFNNLPEFILRH